MGKNIDVSVEYNNVTEIIKNGWVNFAKGADFSSVDADKLLLTAAREGWSAAGVNMLVKELKANIEMIAENGCTPLMLAC